MSLVVLSLLAGVLAGFVATAPCFIFLMTIAVAAVLAIDFGQSSAWTLIVEAVTVLAFSQIGYFTTVFGRAVRNDIRRSDPTSGATRDAPLRGSKIATHSVKDETTR